MRDITGNLIISGSTVKAAMQQLNEGIDGILLCTDEDGVMQGLLTDGDVRRALLQGADLSDPVKSIMNRAFISGNVENSREENLKILDSVIRHVPILDSAGKPVDMVSWSELWRLPITTPSLAGNELKYVADCIETVWISSQGGYIEGFQNAFSAYHGSGMALCTSSGTTALHLALVALGIGPGDEVVVPDITFGASANVVVHTGARPVFVDVHPETLTMDVQCLKGAITENTKAVMPVHLYGHPCDMDPIIEIAQNYDLRVVEDCAEALGAEYKGQKVGLLGDVGCFSFFANKVITTGEGGMVLTKDHDLFDRLSLYRDHGMSKDRKYWHLVPGFNYRMTNLQAAVGLAQLERIDHFLQQRDRVVDTYYNRLKDIAGIKTPLTASWARNIHWLYSIIVIPEILGIDREELALELHKHGIETRPVFPPLHAQPAYRGQDGSFPTSEYFAAHGLSLPTGNTLSVQEADHVGEMIRRVVQA
ncbi:MAG: aminotransferase class I/II-fold pyridoxal phosphate-dependent enzyme [Alphaproteobacteria bacterium]|nr:aminotransferase class I/II-fold pyridoxal phosphate-dependent enzyme [Alphaproteobacteria bacterium]